MTSITQTEGASTVTSAGTVSDDTASPPYSPWVPPFSYNYEGQWIEDSQGQRLMDVRGWGLLTGKGSLGMMEETAARIQDAIGLRVTGLMNVDAKAHKQGTS